MPSGRREGGRWTRFREGRYIPGADEVWAEIEAHAGAVSYATLRFVRRNRAQINRMLGGLQMIGGFGEVAIGATTVAGGVATSATGAGVAVAGLGAFLTVNGYDNFQAGWNTFLTGEVQPTRLNKTLRDIGLSEAEAAAVEIALAGGAGAAAGLTGRALEKAARRGLEREALERFSREPLRVHVNGQSLWLEDSIVKRGDAWEAFDAARTGLLRTPPGFKTFDQHSPDLKTVVSNKAIDLLAPTYERRGALYSRLKQYIGAVADFKIARHPNLHITAAEIRVRRLHVLLANRPLVAAQTAQIKAAKLEALRRGVIMTVEFAD